MTKKGIFLDIENEKQKFHSHKNPISKYDVNILRIVVSNKVPFSKKAFTFFIGYKIDFEKVMPLCIMLPKMGANRRDFDKTKYMSFLIKNKIFLENYNEIWDKVGNTIEK